MQPILFLMRVSFFCNILFLFVLSIHFIPIHTNNDLLSTAIIIGLIIAPCINMITNIIVGYISIFQHIKIKALPIWICVSNAICLILQLVYILLPI